MKENMKILLSRLLAIFIFLYSFPIFSNETWKYKDKSFRIYSSDKLSLITDLNEEFALPYLEYSENFTGLVYEFLSEIRDESPLLKAKIYIFSDCAMFKTYKKENNLKGRTPFFFQKVAQTSWSQWEIAGCLSIQNHFIKALQNEIASRLVNAESEKISPWFAQGLVDYLTYSHYIHDDLNIIPYKNDHYVYQIVVSQKKNNNRFPLKDLFLVNSKEFNKKRKYFFPYSWAFISFIMDSKEDGRKFLTQYYRESKSIQNSSSKNEEVWNRIFRPKDRPKWNEWEDLESNFMAYLQDFQVPMGWPFYKKAKETVSFSYKRDYLEEAIRQNPNYFLYYRELSSIYLQESRNEKSLELAEAAIGLKINDKIALQNAIHSSFDLYKYPICEFYMYIYKQFFYTDTSMQNIEKTLESWRSTNPEIPHYYPDRKEFRINVETKPVLE